MTIADDPPGRAAARRGLAGDLRALTTLLEGTGRWKGRAASGLLVLLLSSAAGLAAARVTGEVVDKGIRAGDAGVTGRLVAVVVACEVAALVLSYGGKYLLTAAGSDAILGVRKRLFRRVSLLPMTYFDRQPLGRTVTRLTHDVEGLEDFFGGTLGRVCTALFSLVLVAPGMLLTSPWLGSVVLAAMLPAAAVTTAARRTGRDLNAETLRANAAINARLSEYLKGLHVLRSFGLEAWSKQKFDERVGAHLGAALDTNAFFASVRPATSFLTSLPLFVTVVAGGYAASRGFLEVGVLVTFVRYCERFIRPIQQLAYEVHVIQGAFSSADRVSEFLGADTEDREFGRDGTYRPERIAGAIEFRGVGLSYHGKKEALRDVSFRVPAGARVGLAGKTGSGKTTTVSVLARLYTHDAGEVLVDGRPVEEYERSALRRRIGFVSQDAVLFAGTVRDNLTGGEEVPDDVVRRACDATGLSASLAAAGLGLDDHLLEGGANVSAGERQVFSLTRALVADPDVLVLDEATANVDEAAEGTVHAAVDTVLEGRTCLVIAHRLATLKECDVVLVFRDGTIVESGPPGELEARGGYYAELVRAGGGGPTAEAGDAGPV